MINDRYNVWHETEGGNYVKELSDEHYKVIEVIEIDAVFTSSTRFAAHSLVVDLAVIIEEFQKDPAASYTKYLEFFGYESLEQLKEDSPIYWKYILAECVALKDILTIGEEIIFHVSSLLEKDDWFVNICPTCAMKMDLPTQMVIGLYGLGHACEGETCRNNALYTLNFNNVKGK